MLKHSVGKLAAPAQSQFQSLRNAQALTLPILVIVISPALPEILLPRRHSIKTVKGTCENLKDIIFYDAHGGSGTC